MKHRNSEHVHSDTGALELSEFSCTTSEIISSSEFTERIESELSSHDNDALNSNDSNPDTSGKNIRGITFTPDNSDDGFHNTDAQKPKECKASTIRKTNRIKTAKCIEIQHDFINKKLKYAKPKLCGITSRIKTLVLTRSKNNCENKGALKLNDSNPETSVTVLPNKSEQRRT